MKATRKPPTTARATCLLCLSVVTMSLASCAQWNKQGPRDPFLAATPLTTAGDSPNSDEETQTGSGSANTILGIPLPMNANEGTVLANPTEIRQVQHLVPAPPAPEETIPASTNAPTEFGPTLGMPAEWCPPEAVPFTGEFSLEACPPGFPMPMPGMTAYPPIVPAWIGGAAIAPIPAHFPDEYLCDGGDRGYPVRYHANMRLGLDTEDTVAEYTDHIGGRHVKPTNKVCVYAPRFGAVRSISSPILGTNVDMLASADKFLRGAGMKNRDATGLHKQHLALGHYRTRERASDIDVDARPSMVDHNQYIASHVKLINTFEDLQFVRSGQLVQTDEVRLAKGVQAAATWTRTQFPIVAAQTDQAQEVTGEFRAQEMVGKEDKRKPGRLRIVKMADKDVAQPGDIITFTIRYDNLGDRELYAIRIIDNLTPRLQYVEDSETSDRAGQLLLQDNDEGSLILEFQLDEPLPGGQGGVVTFQTQVR